MNKFNTVAIALSVIALCVAGVVGLRPINIPEIKIPDITFGALSGPDIISKYLSIGGIRDNYEKAPLTSASTTLCSIKSPAATTTLMFYSIWFDTASTTAITVDIAKASAMNGATTTGIQLEYSVGAAAVDVGTAGVASSSPVSNNMIFKPNQYLRFAVNVGGVGVTNLAATGNCQAIFKNIDY